MKPKQLLFFTILISTIAGATVYVVYPLEPDESVSIVEAYRGQLPGFAASIASVGDLKEYVVVDGVVVSHGFINVSGRHVPFILVDSNGTIYKIILGKRIINGLIGKVAGESGMGEFRISLMTGHNVTVKGYLVRNNVVIARDLVMHDMWSGMPMHRGGWHGKHR